MAADVRKQLRSTTLSRLQHSLPWRWRPFGELTTQLTAENTNLDVYGNSHYYCNSSLLAPSINWRWTESFGQASKTQCNDLSVCVVRWISTVTSHRIWISQQQQKLNPFHIRYNCIQPSNWDYSSFGPIALFIRAIQLRLQFLWSDCSVH